MTDEQLLEYRRVKLLERDKQLSKLIAVNIKLREGLRLVIDMAYVMADAMLNERSKRDG